MRAPKTTRITDPGWFPRMKRIAAVLTLVGATLGLAAPAAMAASGSACVHVDLNVNGTQQVIDQCLPG
jgi:hypothetical protein